MARSDVLVSADWAEQNLNAPKSRLRRGRRGHLRLRRRPHRRRRPARLAKGPAGSGPPRLPEPGAVLRPALGAGASPTTTPSCSTAATTTGSPPTPTGTSSCTATRTSSCIDGGRKKWELDGRPLSQGRGHRARPPSTRPRHPTCDPRVPRRGHRRHRHQEPGRRAQPRRVLRQDPRPRPPAAGAGQRAGHIPGAINVPWSKAANEDGTFKSDDDLAKLYADEGLRRRPRKPSPTAASASARSHTWFVLQEILGKSNVKNYDGSWVEYGSLVGAPIELGA